MKLKRIAAAAALLMATLSLFATTSDSIQQKPADVHLISMDVEQTGLSAEELRRTLCITDRREAIRTALSTCPPGGVVLIAGKGHEPYQEIKGVRHHFDDREEVEAFFNA